MTLSTYNHYNLNNYPTKDENYKQTTKSRPYDDADYYWAYTYSDYTGKPDNLMIWHIVYRGRRVSDKLCTFESVIDHIESFNKNIKPRMMYN